MVTLYYNTVSHDKDLIIHNFIDFDKADNDFDPICLRGKYREFIKEDIEEAVAKFVNNI
ncbi:hypothetical protein [Dyadobacter frigoris]|uniref:hypothetical protein n=1 Tax=Dyadobacter frigoris TaxID=2576211 RepID=UPI001484CEEB|nr:hypothetical protein [Dyadobacter frigoris]GLU51227.1 hypothetical protein Dfri01_06880 [Dyadobacter frigoris]